MSRNCRVAYERRSTSQDAIGQQVATWTEIGTDMVSIKPLRGGEFFARSGEVSDVTHQIETLYRASITLTPADRIRYGARYFNIQSVINKDERNREWVFICTETVSTFVPT